MQLLYSDAVSALRCTLCRNKDECELVLVFVELVMMGFIGWRKVYFVVFIVGTVEGSLQIIFRVYFVSWLHCIFNVLLGYILKTVCCHLLLQYFLLLHERESFI